MKVFEKAYEFTDTAGSIIKWVASARSIKDWRVMMEVVHVEDGQAIATDGKRIHIAKLPMVKEPDKTEHPILPDGDYKVLAETKKSIALGLVEPVDYPNWKAVIPTSDIEREVDFYVRDKSRIFTRVAELIVQCGAAAAVNADFIKPFIGTSWVVRIRKAKSEHTLAAVEFTSGDMTAYIMPLYFQ